MAHGNIIGKFCMALRTAAELAITLVVRDLNTYRPVLFSGCTKCSEYGFQLVHVTLSREIRYTEHEFSEDAANGPDVSTGTIVSGTK